MTTNEARFRDAERRLWQSCGVAPTERLIALARTGATVRVQEVGDGQPVIFVHGVSNAGTSWASLAARLDAFRCILVDRPGCGLSPPLPHRLADMTQLGAFADDLVVDIVDAMDLACASVVATSFGGYFALRSAAAHADRIDRVVVLGWMFGAPVKSTPLWMRIAAQPLLGRVMTGLPVTERMARSLLNQIGLRGALETGRFGPAEISWYVSLLNNTATMRNEIDSTPRILTLRGFDEQTLLPMSLLGDVRMPALLLWGEDDPLGDAEIARQFVAQLPSAELVMLPGVGHAPWIDEPEAVAARVAAFLRA